MSNLLKNWFLGTDTNSRSNKSSVLNSRYSQSENCLALSDDFSEKDEIVLEGGKKAVAVTKTVLSSSSGDSLPQSIETQSCSYSVAYSQSFAYPRLSWQRRYFLLPSFTLIFVAVLPFIQGCLYTVGYRVGKRVLKIVLKAKSE